MPCFSPIFGVDVTPENYDYQAARYAQYWSASKVSAVGSNRVYFPDKVHRSIRFLKGYSLEHFENDMKQGNPLPMRFPCRKCLGCRLDHSKEWANRILMEMCYHQDAWFLTLTYDDDHLPRTFSFDDLGEIIAPAATLVKEDLQLFFKRLRKNSKQKIRYFSAGEYGSTTFRPHYHCIVFGLHLDDVEVLSRSKLGDVYFVSELISRCWTSGYHVLAPVTWASAAYVARYTMKKAGSDYDPTQFDRLNIEPEFQTMSNRPGIGYQYFIDHPDIFDYDFFNLRTPDGGKRVYPPEYFKKLRRRSIEGDEQLFYRSLNSVKRKDLEDRIKLSLTDNSFFDILTIEEDKLESRLKSLVRDL